MPCCYIYYILHILSTVYCLIVHRTLLLLLLLSAVTVVINVLCPLVCRVCVFALYCKSNFPSRDNKDLNWTELNLMTVNFGHFGGNTQNKMFCACLYVWITCVCFLFHLVSGVYCLFCLLLDLVFLYVNTSRTMKHQSNNTSYVFQLTSPPHLRTATWNTNKSENSRHILEAAKVSMVEK